jgi:hypothetical protein
MQLNLAEGMHFRKTLHMLPGWHSLRCLVKPQSLMIFVSLGCLAGSCSANISGCSQQLNSTALDMDMDSFADALIHVLS